MTMNELDRALYAVKNPLFYISDENFRGEVRLESKDEIKNGLRYAQKRIAALEAELEKCNGALLAAMDAAQYAGSKSADLEAENERLRAVFDWLEKEAPVILRKAQLDIQRAAVMEGAE